MTFVRTDPESPHLIDGTVYAYAIGPEGMYVTVRGNDDDQPTIVSFDHNDIDTLRAAVELFDQKRNGSEL